MIRQRLCQHTYATGATSAHEEYNPIHSMQHPLWSLSSTSLNRVTDYRMNVRIQNINANMIHTMPLGHINDNFHSDRILVVPARNNESHELKKEETQASDSHAMPPPIITLHSS